MENKFKNLKYVTVKSQYTQLFSFKNLSLPPSFL